MGNEIKILGGAELMIAEDGIEGIENKINLFFVKRKIKSYGREDGSRWIIGNKNELSKMNEICKSESLNRNGTAFKRGNLFVQRIER